MTWLKIIGINLGRGTGLGLVSRRGIPPVAFSADIMQALHYISPLGAPRETRKKRPVLLARPVVTRVPLLEPYRSSFYSSL